MKNRFVHLKGTGSSVLISCAADSAEIVYWGSALRCDSDAASMLSAISNPVPQSQLDKRVPFSLIPQHADGYFGQPGIEGHFDDGGWSPKFALTDVRSTESEMTASFSDDIAQLRAEVTLALDKTDVLSLKTSVTNVRRGKTYHLQRLASTLPLPAFSRDVISFHGRWCKEFQTKRERLVQGSVVNENRRGRTSHENFPGMISGSDNFSEQQGEVYGMHLAWSGNHRMRTEVMPDGRRYCQGEELLLSGEVKLACDESYQTPTLYATYSDEGLNGMSRNFHDYIRQSVLSFPDRAKPRLVHLNTWEGIYFDHNPDYIRAMALKAAELGAERFIIDDGWFQGRNDDTAALGDWFVDRAKYGDGFGGVIDNIISAGLEPGLWFEPEMVNPDSELYRSHPEWVLKTQGYSQPTERSQYVLNLQIPECFEYLLSCINSILSAYPIGYIKLDHNRVLVQASHHGLPAVSGQTQAFYRLVDAVRERNPGVEIESCSSGGARIDMEVLRRTHRFWTSDTNDPVERQTIQRGFSYFFPPEVMGAHIGTDISHTTGRSNTLAFRAATAMFGHMGAELDPVKMDEETARSVSESFRFHKRHRQLFHQGDTYRLDYPDDTAAATSIVSRDRSEAVVTLAQLQSRSYVLPVPVRLAGLDPEAMYTVSATACPNAQQSMKIVPDWIEGGVTVSGEFLIKQGLQMPVLWPESAFIFHVKKTGGACGENQ